MISVILFLVSFFDYFCLLTTFMKFKYILLLLPMLALQSCCQKVQYCLCNPSSDLYFQFSAPGVSVANMNYFYAIRTDTVLYKIIDSTQMDFSGNDVYFLPNCNADSCTAGKYSYIIVNRKVGIQDTIYRLRLLESNYTLECSGSKCLWASNDLIVTCPNFDSSYAIIGSKKINIRDTLFTLTN